jgi:hypothetical protein
VAVESMGLKVKEAGQLGAFSSSANNHRDDRAALIDHFLESGVLFPGGLLVPEGHNQIGGPAFHMQIESPADDVS